MDNLTSRDYTEFEDQLKDLLSWFQKAVHEDARGDGTVTDSQMTILNARQAILSHCRRYDKKRNRQHGIL